MFKFFITFTFLLFVVLLNLSCSKFSPSNVELSSEKGKQLQELIKKENFSQIYKDSASCLKSNYSEAHFVAVMKETVDMLKSIDSNLEFLDYELGEESINDKWVTFQNYGIGYEELQTKINDKHLVAPKGDVNAMILTGWQNDEDFKLTAFQVLFSENGKSKWIGTSSCKITERKTIVENGETKSITKVVTDPIN